MAQNGFYKVPTVCIGGINAANLLRVILESASSKKNVDGVAIVSAIMAASDPERESRKLLERVKGLPSFRQGILQNVEKAITVQDVIALVPAIIKAVHDTTPLSHNMTNLVVQNFAANIALAAGASPIMSNYGEEAVDLCKLGGALVINMGTVTPEGLENYVKALKAYNQTGRPVVFDPVG
jgi:thiamine-phosphate diphosphorylase / hydroxyethylthiazole kinase